MSGTFPKVGSFAQADAHDAIAVDELITFLKRATELQGKAPISVAILICSQSLRLDRRDHLMLTPQLIKTARLSRSGVYRGLEQLEAMGMITIKRNQGQSPLVTLVRTANTDASVRCKNG